MISKNKYYNFLENYFPDNINEIIYSFYPHYKLNAIYRYINIFKYIKKNPYYLRYINEQTEELCIEAIKKNPNVLFLVNNKTEKIYMELINKAGYLLYNVSINLLTKEEYTRICLHAINKSGCALEYVNENYMNKNIILNSIKKNSSSLKFLKNPLKYITKKELYIISKLAVSKCGLSIQYVHKNIFTFDEFYTLCLLAIKENSNALQYIKKKYQTFELCSLAFQYNINCLIFIKNIDFIKYCFKNTIFY